MSFPRYERYKDSGVEWLGEVPEGWEVLAVWLLFELGRGRVISNEEIMDNIGEYPVFSSQTENNGEMGKINSFDFEGDYLTWTTDGANAGTVFRRSGKFNCTNVCGTLKSKKNIVLLDYGVHALSISTASFVRHDINPKLMNNVMGKIRIPIPSLPEQHTVAAFLDRETGKIDELVSEQERLIALLKEKRQATISHAVTKGLNPAAPMKDSGIEWLGEVPVGWEVCSVKRRTLLITDGAHISPETENGVFCFVSTKDIGIDGTIDIENCLRTSKVSFEYLVKNGCKPLVGDVLFSKDGTIGRTVVVRQDLDFVVASSLIIIRSDCNQLIPDFLNYLCQSNVVTSQVEGLVKGAGLPRLSIQNLLKITGFFPPIQEQSAIVTFLDTETAKIDTLVGEARQAISLLKERRSALISAAVTGKIDVRNLEANV